MPYFFIDYAPCSFAEVWDDLRAGGLVGELFLPQYLEQSALCKGVAVETLNDSLSEWVPREYAPEQKRAMETYLEEARKVAVHVPKDVPKGDWVLRHDFVKGEHYSSELQMTTSALPDMSDEIRQRLVAAQAKAIKSRTTVAVELCGNTLLTYQHNGKRQTDRFLRLVSTDPLWLLCPMQMHISMTTGKRSPRSSIMFDVNTSAWLGPYDKKGEEPFPAFCHQCRKENWQRLFGHLRRLGDAKALKKRISGWLRENRPRLRGLGVSQAFRSLPMPKRLL
jgi:hypothetical protein